MPGLGGYKAGSNNSARPITRFNLPAPARSREVIMERALPLFPIYEKAMAEGEAVGSG
jgi:hypothetical protein